MLGQSDCTNVWISNSGEVNPITESQRNLLQDDRFMLRLQLYKDALRRFPMFAEKHRKELNNKMQEAYDKDTATNRPSPTE